MKVWAVSCTIDILRLGEMCIRDRFEHKPKVIPLNDKAFKTGLDIGAEARK